MFTMDERELYEIINPYAKWSRPGELINEQKNQAAKQALLNFYKVVSIKRIDPIYSNKAYHTEYVYYLYHIWGALEREAYPVVCNEIISFLYYEPFFQGRNVTNVMLLLRQYLDIKEEGPAMQKSKFKFRGRKKEPIADEGNESYVFGGAGVNYRHALDYINITLEDKETSEKNALLEYYMMAIRQDIQSDYLTAVLYRNEYYDRNILQPLPTCYQDKVGNKVDPLSKTARVIDLADNDFTVISFPWRQESLVDAVLNVFLKGFDYDTHDHKAIYYAGLGVVLVTNGKHSISAATVKREGQIVAEEYDVTQLFPHVMVDVKGMQWINCHTGEALCEVRDFRIPLLYELAKRKQAL
ncbi:DUF6710 family protein [Paenibacillus senegalimassiliensis]|uniref:DUF6710 family protein n=1 Tax=Paenibacillus senegalimassiliensis TaxID=1737426 RepID=UPI00073F3637|nr:DUF6710 family protein [Paenibacillus senegalimassiliensis]